MSSKPIGIYHEHQDWFRPLFAALDRRGVPYERIDATSHRFDPSETSVPWSVVFNRASPSAYLRGNGHAIQYTLHWLRHLDRLRVPTINGAAAYALELSKANQLDLLRELGLPFPRTVVVNHASQVLAAAEGLRYPVLVKANVGGSGAGIVRYNARASLEQAVQEGTIDLGIDQTALVQESAPLRNGHITRVETLDGEYLYAINVYPTADSFDLCPADACQTTGGVELVRGACAIDAPKSGMRVERTHPSDEIIAQVERITRAAGIEIGGVEFLVDDRDGHHYFYDINALSNFVADAPNVVGFDPFETLVDYLQRRLEGPRVKVA
jgi:glutathione synthase/RimK-type ligase-like ATP-grasp enzyme